MSSSALLTCVNLFNSSGPLDTDMQLHARSNTVDDNIRKSMAAMHAEGHLLTCEESVGKLIKVLLKDSYESGAHLDFYDL